MSIVLNEYEWAEKMINNHELGNKPTETLNRVAKYYYANRYSKKEIRRLLDNFLLKCDSGVSLSKWTDTLDRAAKNADKYPIINIDGVDITKNEMAKIEKLKGKQLRRLAFTLLCVAKYWDTVSKDNDHWVNNQDNEIMQMANVKTSIKRQSLLFGELRKAGYINFARRIDSLNVQVSFTEDGETAMFIRDFRNLGYQYQKYCGEPFFNCANCGITVKIQKPSKGRRQKYCPSCAAEIHTKQNIESVMRRRNSIRV